MVTIKQNFNFMI